MAKDIAASVRQKLLNKSREEKRPFSAAFVDRKQPQWQSFRRRLGQPHVPEALSEVVDAVVTFLAPVMEREVAGPSQEVWVPPGPWVERSM